MGHPYIQQQLICFKVLVSEGPTKKQKTSRKQTTLRINSDSADITRVPRPSKSTHHHECTPKQKQTKVGVMSEKPNNTGKTSKSNHRKEEKVHLKKILSSPIYRRSRQKTGFEKNTSQSRLSILKVWQFSKLSRHQFGESSEVRQSMKLHHKGKPKPTD